MAEKAQRLITEFRGHNAVELEAVKKNAEPLLDACITIQRSWSGSFAGWHGTMYFREFEQPTIHERFSREWGGIHGIPVGWRERNPEEVKKKIESLLDDGFSTDEFEKAVKELRKNSENLKEEVCLALSSLRADQLSNKEQELLGKLEKFTFGKRKGEFIQDGLPKTMMSRDSGAISEGMCVPSWLYYEGVALEGQTLIESIEDFGVTPDRLARSLSGNKSNGSGGTSSGPLRDLHKDVYSKCHELYEKGAYAEAVEKSFKVVRDRLRRLTGYETGSEAFGKGKLHIEGAAAPNVEPDFNDAVKFLAMAIDRFRNEKSHTSDARIDDPVRAYEYLRLSSLAMNLLEKARILP